MQRREFLANAAKAVPVAGAYAAAAVAHRPKESEPAGFGTIGVPLFQPMEEGRVRFMIWVDPAEALKLREEKAIAELARQSVNRFLEAVAADPTGVQMIPGFATAVDYEWDAETFTRQPDPTAKIPHLRDPKRGLRYLLFSIVAEDLCRFVWHRQGRIFGINDCLAIESAIEADSRCPRWDDEPAAWEGAEPLLSPDNAAKLKAYIAKFEKARKLARSKNPNAVRPV